MKIKVISRGEAEFDAEPKHLAPAIREDAAAGKENGDWEIIRQMVRDCTEDERGFIDHRQYVTVTDDDGTVLWAGWLDGRDEPAPDSEGQQPATANAEVAYERWIEQRNPDDVGSMAGFTAGWQEALIAVSGWPRCPNGCGCRLGTEDADQRDCACDGLCCYDEIEVSELFTERDKLRAALQRLADDGNLEARDRLAGISANAGRRS